MTKETWTIKEDDPRLGYSVWDEEDRIAAYITPYKLTPRVTMFKVFGVKPLASWMEYIKDLHSNGSDQDTLEAAIARIEFLYKVEIH